MDDDDDASEQSNDSTFLLYQTPADLTDLKFIKSVALASTVREIPDYAFEGCEKLLEIKFSVGMTRIGACAFQGCRRLERVASFPSVLLTIGRGAFIECFALKHVKLNEGLLRIEDDAFSQCTKLEGIKIPSTVKYIGRKCFNNCMSIEFFHFGSNLEEIGKSAFSGCKGLTVARLPPSIRILNPWTFAWCKNLLSVELPLGLQHVGDRAFFDCIELRSLAFPSSVEPTSGDPFRGTPSLTSVFFPDEGVSEGERTGDSLIWQPEASAERVAMKYETCIKRFYGFPIHEFCHKQSYLSLADALECLEVALVAAPPDAVSLVDDLGMTIFHILALSSKPRINLFQILQARCGRRLMEAKDRYGCRPFYYLFANSSVPAAARRILLDYLAQMTVLERASKLGLLKWRAVVIAKVEDTLDQSNPKEVASLYKVLEEYERRETLSMLELKIWHSKLHKDREATPMDACREPKRPKIDERQVARVGCGADVIIANVLPFYGFEEG